VDPGRWQRACGLHAEEWQPIPLITAVPLRCTRRRKWYCSMPPLYYFTAHGLVNDKLITSSCIYGPSLGGIHSIQHARHARDVAFIVAFIVAWNARASSSQHAASKLLRPVAEETPLFRHSLAASNILGALETQGMKDILKSGTCSSHCMA
jgi:hypothetical protein